MIKFTISENEICATDTNSGRTVSRPNNVGHPRYVFANIKKASELIGEMIRELEGSWKLIKPIISVSMDYELAGEITEIDERIAVEPFEYHGREVSIDWNK